MGVKLGRRSQVVLLRDPPEPDLLQLSIWWELDGRTTAPMNLVMGHETPPVEVGIWLTRIAAEIFRQAMEADVPAVGRGGY